MGGMVSLEPHKLKQVSSILASATKSKGKKMTGIIKIIETAGGIIIQYDPRFYTPDITAGNTGIWKVPNMNTA